MLNVKCIAEVASQLVCGTYGLKYEGIFAVDNL